MTIKVETQPAYRIFKLAPFFGLLVLRKTDPGFDIEEIFHVIEDNLCVCPDSIGVTSGHVWTPTKGIEKLSGRHVTCRGALFGKHGETSFLVFDLVATEDYSSFVNSLFWRELTVLFVAKFH